MSIELQKALEERIRILEEENRVLKAEIEFLRKRLEELKELVKKLDIKKTSKNSSKPQSQDIGGVNRTKSLRELSKLSTGGQRGHEGSTLESTTNPDAIVMHKLESCEKCGKDLSEELAIQISSYQTLDIPKVKPIWTEHQGFKTTCSCGHCNQALLSNLGVIYGPEVRALISYLSVEHYIPYGRIAQILKDQYEFKMSEGTIDNILKKMGEQVTPIYDQIKKEVQKSDVIGSDEIGFRVNEKPHWVWTWQSATATFLHVNKSRGSQVAAENYSEGFSQSILVHDRLAAQINTEAGDYQFCMAHILRELKYIQEIAPENNWSRKLESLLEETIHLEKELGHDFSERRLMKLDAETALEKLLESPAHGEVAERLKKSLIKHRDKLWHYIENPEVPATNNASERALRNVKVNQKVSTSMRTLSGAEIFCKLRSIADTYKKQGTSFFKVLSQFALHPG